MWMRDPNSVRLALKLPRSALLYGVFFFQAEDGIRDGRVTGVQTCALPICFINSMIAGRSSVTTTCAVAQISNVSLVRRAPGRAKPSSSHSLYIEAMRGE